MHAFALCFYEPHCFLFALMDICKSSNRISSTFRIYAPSIWPPKSKHLRSTWPHFRTWPRYYPREWQTIHCNYSTIDFIKMCTLCIKWAILDWPSNSRWQICCLIQAIISSLNKQHLADRLANTSLMQPLFATHKFLRVISECKGNIRKNLSIEYGFPSGTHLMEILHIHLMIYLTECNKSADALVKNLNLFLNLL